MFNEKTMSYTLNSGSNGKFTFIFRVRVHDVADLASCSEPRHSIDSVAKVAQSDTVRDLVQEHIVW